MTSLATEWYVRVAEDQIKKTYNDKVSVLVKSKSLRKFGRNDDVDAGVEEMVWVLGGFETLQTTNAIDTVVSSDAGDHYHRGAHHR